MSVALVGQAPVLLIPGPVNTRSQVRRAMDRDWGSWDDEFIGLTARVSRRLLDLAGADPQRVCIPIQGCGTFAVEATLRSLLGPEDRLLVPVNGTYARRIVTIAESAGRSCTTLDVNEGDTPTAQALREALQRDRRITHLALVHCETSTGALSPIEVLAETVAAMGRRLIVDAVSTFGAFCPSLSRLPCDALVATPNKCLEAMPGMGFVLARREALARSAGNAASVSLDLQAQSLEFETSGRWRFTPPTPIVAALDAALDALQEEGGPQARGRRYQANGDALVAAMREAGFRPLLDDDDPARCPVVLSFHEPDDPCFEFATFAQELRRRGYVIYPGRLTRLPTFRVACIGALHPPDLERAAACMHEVARDMGVMEFGRRSPDDAAPTPA